MDVSLYLSAVRGESAAASQIDVGEDRMGTWLRKSVHQLSADSPDRPSTLAP